MRAVRRKSPGRSHDKSTALQDAGAAIRPWSLTMIQTLHRFHPMSAKPITSIAISEFKATCLAVLERVRRTGTPVLVTRRGEPVAEIVPPSAGALRSSWLGAMRGTATITGDVIEPVSDPDEWDAVSR